MSLSDISSRTAILDAIEECDQLGRDHFLVKHGYGRAIEYFLEYKGRFYDSKAIVGVAHGYEHPDKGPLRSQDFVGGRRTVKPKLEQLGFRVCVGHEDVLMGVTRPYRRICRQFVDGSYSEGGRWGYLLHPKFAEDPEHYIRAFFLLQGDLHRIFEYIEPADKNLKCYSYRIHELLLRSCVEVEANCKAILKENGYSRTGEWNMNDYRKIEQSHRLSSYRVKLPVWQGNRSVLRPFAPWATTEGKLPWYSAYNSTKHDRHAAFEQATFEHMIGAVSGLVVLLSAQFWTHDFTPSNWTLSVGGPKDDMESAIGNYFRVGFPEDWPIQDRYDFKWQELENEKDPFQQYPYS